MDPKNFRANLRLSDKKIEEKIKNYRVSLRADSGNHVPESESHGKPVPNGYSSYYLPESARQSEDFRRQRYLNSSDLTQGFELLP